MNVSFVNNPAITEGNETVAYDADQRRRFVSDRGRQNHCQRHHQHAEQRPAASSSFTAPGARGHHQSPGRRRRRRRRLGHRLTSGGSGQALDTTGIANRLRRPDLQHQLRRRQDHSGRDQLDQWRRRRRRRLDQFQGTGINIQSTLSGADFSIGENGGTTAAQLGVLSLTTSTSLSDLNLGEGINPIGNGTPDFIIDRPDGSQLSISVAGTDDRRRDQPDQQRIRQSKPGNKITASLSTVGNGIQLSTAAAGGGAFQVVEQNSSQVAQELGLVASGNSVSAPATVSGTVATITGSDPNPQEVSGVFDTLLRLSQALTNNDQPEIQRTTALLDQDSSRVSLAKASWGCASRGWQRP